MAKRKKNSENTKRLGHRQIRSLIHHWWACKKGTVSLENSVSVSYKIKHSDTT